MVEGIVARFLVRTGFLVFLGQFTTNDDNLLKNRLRENLDDTKKEGDVEQEGELMAAFSSGTICKLCLNLEELF